MQRNSQLLWFWLLIGVFGSAPWLGAFQIIPLTISQLTHEASVVIHGRVLSKSCQRDPEGRIYTRVKVSVEEVWKGSLQGKTYTIVHGGGILGQRRLEVSGQVDYQIGEEVVVFAVSNERGEGVTVALAQGKFTVLGGNNDAIKTVSNPVLDLSPATQTTPDTTSLSPLHRLTLGELRSQVQKQKP